MVNDGVEMTNRRYRELFGITSRTALRDLNELVESDQAKKAGQGRNVRYIAR